MMMIMSQLFLLEQNTQHSLISYHSIITISHTDSHHLSWTINLFFCFCLLQQFRLLLLRSQHRQTGCATDHRGNVIWRWASLCTAGFSLTSLWCHHHNNRHCDYEWKRLPLLSQVCLCWLLQTHTSGSCD